RQGPPPAVRRAGILRGGGIAAGRERLPASLGRAAAPARSPRREQHRGASLAAPAGTRGLLFPGRVRRAARAAVTRWAEPPHAGAARRSARDRDAAGGPHGGGPVPLRRSRAA